MLFNIVEDFYNPNDLGIIILNFINLNFKESFQSHQTFYGSERINAYPCYESDKMKYQDNNLNPYNIFKKTFENKSNLKILELITFFRKTKLSELKESPSWNQHKPHKDSNLYDIAGVIYFNGSSLKDGTNFYLDKNHYEPTAIVGPRFNRCVFYDPQLPHCPSMCQQVEERWTQPFFLITKEEK